MVYRIETRYQYKSMYEGLTWTKWFIPFFSKRYETEEEARESIKKAPKEINKSKYQYRIITENV